MFQKRNCSVIIEFQARETDVQAKESGLLCRVVLVGYSSDCNILKYKIWVGQFIKLFKINWWSDKTMTNPSAAILNFVLFYFCVSV